MFYASNEMDITATMGTAQGVLGKLKAAGAASHYPGLCPRVPAARKAARAWCCPSQSTAFLPEHLLPPRCFSLALAHPGILSQGFPVCFSCAFYRSQLKLLIRGEHQTHTFTSKKKPGPGEHPRVQKLLLLLGPIPTGREVSTETLT